MKDEFKNIGIGISIASGHGFSLDDMEDAMKGAYNMIRLEAEAKRKRKQQRRDLFKKRNRNR